MRDRHMSAHAAAWSDRRAASDARIADGHELLRLVSPGLALLAGALQLLVLREAIALAFGGTDADGLPRAGIVAENDDGGLAGLRLGSGRKRRKAAGEGRGRR